MLNLSRTIADAHYIAHNNTTSKAKFHVFILGMREFRMTMTQHYDAYEVLEWYDRGRELANVLTFRYFDTTSA